MRGLDRSERQAVKIFWMISVVCSTIDFCASSPPAPAPTAFSFCVRSGRLLSVIDNFERDAHSDMLVWYIIVPYVGWFSAV